jgi:hypothetical protein
MRLQPKELEYLSAWAREERAPDLYVLPAHQLQARHQVKGITLIRTIKAWARAERRREEDIFTLYCNPNPPWPWSSREELQDPVNDIQAGESKGEGSQSNG